MASDEENITFNIHFEAEGFDLVVFIDEHYEMGEETLVNMALQFMREHHGIELVGKVRAMNVEAL
jgi:hypothetical protein